MKGTANADEPLAVLQRRAAELARPVQAGADTPDLVQVLAFTLAGRRCLVGADVLCEVRPLRSLMPVPLAPPPLAGLVPLRGGLLPVFDLAAALGLPTAAGATAGVLLVLGRQAPSLGVAAAAVHGLRALAVRAAEQRSQPLEDLRPELVRGLTADGELFLDGERLLSFFAPPAGRPARPVR